MSQMNKDTIIQQCADGYRTVTGTLDPVKYGELGGKIAQIRTETHYVGAGLYLSYLHDTGIPAVTATYTILAN